MDMKSIEKDLRREGLFSDNRQPPAGAGIRMGRDVLFCSACLTSSHGTSVYCLGLVVASGFPAGPNIPTSASACLRAQIHLFRRLADIN